MTVVQCHVMVTGTIYARTYLCTQFSVFSLQVSHLSSKGISSLQGVASERGRGEVRQRERGGNMAQNSMDARLLLSSSVKFNNAHRTLVTRICCMKQTSQPEMHASHKHPPTYPHHPHPPTPTHAHTHTSSVLNNRCSKLSHGSSSLLGPSICAGIVAVLCALLLFFCLLASSLPLRQSTTTQSLQSL